ncbi:hypothetical protein USA:Philadelphia,PA_000011 [unidentified adenovirus]|nr:hypothetical protein USA:Philadelphia,PA_000011 [unidentified adenovirus]
MGHHWNQGRPYCTGGSGSGSNSSGHTEAKATG